MLVTSMASMPTGVIEQHLVMVRVWPPGSSQQPWSAEQTKVSIQHLLSPMERWHQHGSGFCGCWSWQPTACSRKVLRLQHRPSLVNVDHVVNHCWISRPPHRVHGLMVLDDETIEWLLNTWLRSSSGLQELCEVALWILFWHVHLCQMWNVCKLYTLQETAFCLWINCFSGIMLSQVFILLMHLGSGLSVMLLHACCSCGTVRSYINEHSSDVYFYLCMYGTCVFTTPRHLLLQTVCPASGIFSISLQYTTYKDWWSNYNSAP